MGPRHGACSSWGCALSQVQKRNSSQLRKLVKQFVESRNEAELEQLIKEDSRSIRHLIGMSYQLDQTIQETVAKGVQFATKHHPSQIGSVIKRLLWAMDELSGTNAQSAPGLLQAIAKQDPELLLPYVPELVRLSKDEALHDGIADALCIVVHKCPGQVGARMSRRLQERIERGECCESPSRRRE